MTNKTLIGTAYDGQVRFIISDTKELVQYMHEINGTSKTAIAALGRAVTIAALMGLQLKDDQKVSTIIKGDGELGQIIADADSNGNVKGLVSNPYVDLPLNEKGKVDVSGAVGKTGTLKVIKDLNLKEPFIGEVNLISGELAEDFTYYFSASEQIPTAISAGVLIDTDYTIKTAGGLIVQIMGGANNDVVDKLEKAVLELKPLTTLLIDYTLEEILSEMFKSEYKVLEEENIEFICDCSEDKFIRGIKMLPVSDIIDIKKDKIAKVKCDFCQTEYEIETDKL